MNRRILFWLIPLLSASVAFAQPKSAPTQESDAHFQLPATDDGFPGAGPVRHQDWFRKLWVERRSKWAKQIHKDHGALVFLGDSITQGWGDDLDGSFPGVKVANRGISGDTTRGVLFRLFEDVLVLRPSGVVILIGTNDLEDGADPETIAANLRLILEELEASDAKMPIVVCQVFPSSATKKRPASKIKKLNQLYGKVVKGDTHVTFIETWPLFANENGDAKIEEFKDLLHPNKAGYAKWAAGLRVILSTLGFMENEMDHFTPDPGFVSLFDGKDLNGWGYRPTPEGDIESARKWKASDPGAPPWPIIEKQVSFDGLTSSPDGRYVAKYGRLIVTTPCEFRKIQKLSTTREFPKDFILKLEFRAAPDADSGVFIRDPQLQCRDYLIAGPYKDLKKYKPQDWNEMVITVKGQEALCTCNGEILEPAYKLPATGPIGLVGDRGQMEDRHIEVKELP